MKNQYMFMSFAFDTYDFLVPNAVKLLNRIQRMIHSNLVSPRSINVVFKIIGFIIQKSLTACLFVFLTYCIVITN